MDTGTSYREVIERVLAEYSAIPYAHGEMVSQVVFDREGDHYLIMVFGVDNKRRVHGCLVHIDIVNDQVLIQRDGTEKGIAPDLISGGIPATQVILAFHHAGARPYSDFAA